MTTRQKYKSNLFNLIMTSTSTYLPKVADLPTTAKWYIIDAAGKTVGKVAERAARTLTGKDRVDFTPHIDLGDGVIIINASQIVMTGSKLRDKMYRRHSGYRGNMKEICAGELLEKNPEHLVELAVKGMLPKNKLADARLTRLRVFAGSDHTHAAQQPVSLSL